MRKPHAIAEEIRQKGKRATAKRISILETLAHALRPMTISELVRATKSHAHQTTVYRTLDSLVRDGLIQRVDLADGVPRFEYITRHHHHLVCESCGSVEDTDICLPNTTFTSAVSRSKKFAEIKSHSLEFFGTCKSCLRHA